MEKRDLEVLEELGIAEISATTMPGIFLTAVAYGMQLSDPEDWVVMADVDMEDLDFYKSFTVARHGLALLTSDSYPEMISWLESNDVTGMDLVGTSYEGKTTNYYEPVLTEEQVETLSKTDVQAYLRDVCETDFEGSEFCSNAAVIIDIIFGE